MIRPPVVRPQVLIKALQRAGFDVVRVRGSHYQLRNPANGRRVTVPHHSRDLSRRTVASILAQAGLSAEELMRLM